MSSRTDITIEAEDGTPLAGWLFIPDDLDAPAPAITMAHGYCCTRYHGIEPFAEAFADAGFVVLLHDHRGFGDSGGQQRQDIDPYQQITDWRQVISALEQRPEVNPDQLGIWGCSYAGGHSLVLGATDRRLKAVVSQVPTTYGWESALRRVPPEDVTALEQAFADDDRALARGEEPARQTLVSTDPQVRAAYHDPVATAYYLDHAPSGGRWTNDVTVRSTRWSRMYSPVEYIQRISPTPLLMIVGDRDVTTVTDLALRAYEQALEPKRLSIFPGDHFDSYVAARDRNIAAAVEWFGQHL